jgi:hypothetical protein
MSESQLVLDVTDFDRGVRWHVYRAFADTGQPPTLTELASAVGGRSDQVAASLERLQQAHALVLAPGTPTVWMAHPFSAVPTAYGFSFNRRSYWANCAWDFFGLAALVGASGAFSARCAYSGATLRATFDRGALLDGDGIIHFVVQPRRFWDNVAFT